MRFILLAAFFTTSYTRSSEISSPPAQKLSGNECLQQSFSNHIFSITIPFKEASKLFDCKFYVKPYVADVCRLQVTFNQFQLVTSKSCKEQYLKIGDKRLCGSIVGTQLFPFAGNTTEIVYRGDGKHPVQINVQQERCKVKALARKCDVASSEAVTKIFSPNYPNSYPTPLTCLYTIKTLPHETCQVRIRFIDFNIPESTDCLKGRLLIDGEPYCGRKSGLVILRNVTNDFSFEFSEGSGQTKGGFQLSVEKEQCQKFTTNISADQEPYFSRGVFPGGLSLCCNRPYSTPYFVLTSPGFLQNTQNEVNCVYQIIQASPQACRIRLTFVHFWIGQEDAYYGCVNGFLELDGRRICGCRDGLSFVTYFNGGVKELRYHKRGSSNQGFLIEVVQEDCFAKSGKSLPEDTTENPDNEVEVFTNNRTDKDIDSRFLVPGDNSQCFQLDPTRWLEKIQAFAQSVKNYCPVPNQPTIPPYPQPPIIPPPIIPPVPNYPINPIIPPPTPPIAPPTYPINPIIPRPNPPISPPLHPINPIIPPPIGPPSYPINPIAPPHRPINPPTYPINPIIPPPSRPIPPLYPINPIIPPRPPINFPPIATPPIIPPQFPYPPSIPAQCQVLRGVQGNIQSPRYPLGYPSSLKCCYRIRQVYGYCRVQLIVLDFDVAWTPKCSKDYLLLDGRAKYCGRSLQSTTSYLNFRNNYASIDLITSSYGFLGGRGFRAVYRQLPCSYPRSSDSENTCQTDVPFPYPSKPLPPTSPPEWSVPSYPPAGGGFDLNVPAER